MVKIINQKRNCHIVVVCSTDIYIDIMVFDKNQTHDKYNYILDDLQNHNQIE